MTALAFRRLKAVGCLGGFFLVICFACSELPTDSVFDPPSVPVLPGLVGFGVDTPAGRGGAILRVTTLADGGEGSLRDAVARPGARTLLFEVGGTIELSGDLLIREPFLTIAGETAPSPGISLAGAGIVVETHDVLIHHVRVRVGDSPSGPDPVQRDGIRIGDGAFNVVVDHCSVSWAIDEGISVSATSSVHDVTFPSCIVSDNLYRSLHPKGPHSKGALLFDRAKDVALVGNLFAHNWDRNPGIGGGVTAVVVNNVMYDSRYWVSGIWGSREVAGPTTLSLVGNAYLLGPTSSPAVIPIYLMKNLEDGTLIFLEDNFAENANTIDLRYTLRALSPSTPETGPWSIAAIDTTLGFDPRADKAPIWIEGLQPGDAAFLEATLLPVVGARPRDRDPIDERVVAQVASRTGGVIDSQEDVGGWPRLVTSRRTLTTPDDPHGDQDEDGYTNLEEWLHEFARVLER